jgi:hypothetical protein
VKDAFEDSLSRILNKRQVDVLADIERAKAKGKPYTIVFCGVNGVGKSTNLAKICYWLGEHGFQVQLAACDTFRAGAVEQLRTHAVRLGVSGPLLLLCLGVRYDLIRRALGIKHEAWTVEVLMHACQLFFCTLREDFALYPALFLWSLVALGCL